MCYYTMSRNGSPSLAQLIQLVEFMEAKRFLATGHARTAMARNRTRAAWQEIAIVLNSERIGCLKSWQQWCKYWKDKKGAVKRKATEVAKQQEKSTGAPDEDIACLSNIEQRIMALISAKSNAKRNANKTVDPLQNESSKAALRARSIRDIMRSPSPGPSQPIETADIKQPINSDEEMMASNDDNEEVLQQLAEDESSQTSDSISHAVRRLQKGERRRAIHQSPDNAGYRPRHRFSNSKRRRTDKASLTERLIAIEEKRVEMELITARSHELYAQSQQAMAASINKLSEALTTLAENLLLRRAPRCPDYGDENEPSLSL
ncbi:hypothetical protein evm_003231 [Chilo suppressalis]|nr:hypothetical protein evm_003231 [Chilo suppressalis]